MIGSLRLLAHELEGSQIRTRLQKVKGVYLQLSSDSSFSQARCASPISNHFTLNSEVFTTGALRTPDSALL